MVAKCKSFTKAADKLYITQPVLSRQINSMEEELNLQLFIRNTRSVELTPAAVVLLEEFEKLYDDYNMAIIKASSSFQGFQGELKIGVLEGERVGDLLPPVLQYFDEYNPNVKINLRNYSFNKLIEMLYSNELDLALTLLFDVKERKKLKYKIIAETRDHIVVNRHHKLANQKTAKLSDFKEDTFIIVSPDDSAISGKLIVEACKTQGFMPKIKFASSVQEEMLWVEAGVGVCILDTRNNLYRTSAVKFLKIDQISDPSLCIVWNEANYNPIKNVFVDLFKEI